MGDNLVLKLLGAMRADIAEIRTEQREQRGCIGAMERGLSHLDER